MFIWLYQILLLLRLRQPRISMALPDVNCELRILVGTDGLQPRASHVSAHCWTPTTAAGPQPQGPDLSGHCRIEWLIDRRTECQNRCQVECQIECQHICEIECHGGGNSKKATLRSNTECRLHLRIIPSTKPGIPRRFTCTSTCDGI